MPRTPVRLNIYDMYWINDYASVVGVGVYHSGVEVHGIEYAYGGHPYDFSGIFENQPGDAEELGENFKFKETIHLGETDFSPYEVKKMIQNLSDEYRGDKYHLITKNCNHFSQFLAKTLTGSDIPPWINRLANMSSSIPFLERWIPQEWLTPVALQQSLEEQKLKEQNLSMNYPVPMGQDALDGYDSPSKRNSDSNIRASLRTNGKQQQENVSTTVFSGGLSSYFSGTKSAPTSARNVNPTALSGTVLTNFSKIWLSIKSFPTDPPTNPSITTTNGSSYMAIPTTTLVSNPSTSETNLKTAQSSTSNISTTSTTILPTKSSSDVTKSNGLLKESNGTIKTEKDSKANVKNPEESNEK